MIDSLDQLCEVTTASLTTPPSTSTSISPSAAAGLGTEKQQVKLLHELTQLIRGWSRHANVSWADVRKHRRETGLVIVDLHSFMYIFIHSCIYIFYQRRITHLSSSL